MPEERLLLKRIQWLMTIRLAVITITLIIGVLTSGGEFSAGYAKFYYYIAMYYVISLLYIVLMQRTSHFTFLAYFQIAVDLLAVTSIVDATMTDPINIYANLYVIVIVLSVVVLPRYGVLLSAVVSSLLYIGVILIHLPVFYKLGGFSYQEVFHVSYMYVTVFLGVGYLSHFISRLLRERSEEINRLKMMSNYVFRNINSGMFIVNTSGDIEFVNPAARQIIGCTAESLMGKNWRTVLGVHELDSVNQRNDLESGHEIELSCRRENGMVIPLAVTCAPIEYQHGRKMFHIVLFRDLRQMKENEKRMMESERLGAIVEMSSTIAHELRNPLASISGSAQLLAENEPEQKFKKLADIIVKEADRLDAIVDDFLSYTRLRGLEISQTDLNELVSEVIVLMYHGRTMPEDIKLIYHERPEPLIMPIDGKQMKQALFNLGINALEAMPGGGEIEFAILDNHPGRIEIRVRDTGVGMTSEVLKHIYDPFFSTKAKGSGVGMYVVQKIIQNHNGTIECETEEGKGTTFHIYLPYNNTGS
jgi:two-component system sensor histidine kinase PilS (NtrC family)